MSEETAGLNENQIIEHVCAYLRRSGYNVNHTCDTTQRGIDIDATRAADRLHLHIEAKGATSARQNSYQFGRPFESSAVRVHVAEAVFKSLQVLDPQTYSDGPVRAGIALPDNEHHRRLINSVCRGLMALGIAVFWVAGDGSVQVESSWQVPA